MLRAERGGSSDLLARGVYVAPYTVRGRPVLLAVDHTGALRAHRPVPAEWPVRRAIGALRAWLDLKHPVPRPVLMTAPAPPPPAASPVDPRDGMTRVQFLLYMRRRRRMALPSIPFFREHDAR